MLAALIPVPSKQASCSRGGGVRSGDGGKAHPQVVHVQEHGCRALVNVCMEDTDSPAVAWARMQRAAQAGAIEAALNAMRAHPQAGSLQRWACWALAKVCDGDDAAGLARSQRAAEAGAIEAVVDAMRAHPQDEDVQMESCGALTRLCGGGDAAGQARSQRAAEAGAIEEVLVAMRAHPQVVLVQAKGCDALLKVCGIGADAAARARRRRATQAGGRVAAAAAMQAHPGGGEVYCRQVQRQGHLVLDVLPE